jgi:hypothetical protein
MGPYRLGLRLDESRGYPVITADSVNIDFPDGFPSVVWPFGFSASVEDDQGHVAAPDGTEFLTGEQYTFVGEFEAENFYVCSIDGVNYF